MKTEEFFFRTEDGFELYTKRFFPDEESEIKGVVQFVHGMLEHIGRYDNLAAFFVEQGFAFCAYDQRGHGNTAQHSIENGTGKFGVVAPKNGFQVAMEDIHFMVEETKKRFPEKDVFILSYSFGSFVTQRFMQEYGDTVKGCVLCGTNGPDPVQNFSTSLVTRILCLFGRERRIAFVEELVSNIYIRHMPGKHECNLDWMCTLKEDIENYLADPWCYFRESIGFHHDMLVGNLYNHKARNVRKVPVTLPVLFVFGKEDPVGGYGKKIEKLAAMLRKNGSKDVSPKSYDRGGHEILKEYCSQQVWSDIAGWITARLN